MRAKRKLGKTIYKSKKKRKLDDVRVQSEGIDRTSESNGKIDQEYQEDSKITNLRTGEKTYMKTIDESKDGRNSLRQFHSTAGQGGDYQEHGGEGGSKYITFDKDMKLSSGSKEIKEIRPRDVCKHYGVSANSKEGRRLARTMQRMADQYELIKGSKYGTYIFRDYKEKNGEDVF